MIPEEMINTYVDRLLTQSSPGDRAHALLVVTAPRGARGPLGTVTEDQCHTEVYILAYVEGQGVDSPEAFIAKALFEAHLNAVRERKQILFAGLAFEVENRVRNEEATLLYATCRDGRRWFGERYLTGLKAGQTNGPRVFTGPVDTLVEKFGGFGEQMRRMVSIK